MIILLSFGESNFVFWGGVKKPELAEIRTIAYIRRYTYMSIYTYTYTQIHTYGHGKPEGSLIS